MTTWVENPHGGRARGPRGVVRAWAEVLVRPGRFFRTGVSPGDQAPGLVFGVCVAVAFLAGRFAAAPATVPEVYGGILPSALLALTVTALFVAPALLHLVAALQTALLVVLVRDRGGVSETVQVVAYAAAPGALAGPPVPELRAACALYGAVLLVVGLRAVHGTTTLRAILAGALPATLVFGVGFRGIDAFGALLARTAAF